MCINAYTLPFVAVKSEKLVLCCRKCKPTNTYISDRNWFSINLDVYTEVSIQEYWLDVKTFTR